MNITPDFNNGLRKKLSFSVMDAWSVDGRGLICIHKWLSATSNKPKTAKRHAVFEALARVVIVNAVYQFFNRLHFAVEGYTVAYIEVQ